MESRGEGSAVHSLARCSCSSSHVLFTPAKLHIPPPPCRFGLPGLGLERQYRSIVTTNVGRHPKRPWPKDALRWNFHHTQGLRSSCWSRCRKSTRFCCTGFKKKTDGPGTKLVAKCCLEAISQLGVLERCWCWNVSIHHHWGSYATRQGRYCAE